jgi:hypothetical protein
MPRSDHRDGVLQNADIGDFDFHPIPYNIQFSLKYGMMSLSNVRM